jgi:propionate CoA-transferase
MARNKTIDAETALALVKDGDTVGLIGGGGGLVEASALFSAIEQRFLTDGDPRNLTIVHALGIGDRESRGINCFAHEGMVKRVIGGHWVWSPRMQQFARDNKIEAYVLPGGVIMQLMREIGAGRAGLLTHVGLGTFVDPRQDGGRMNDLAKDDLVEVVCLGGRELLLYKPFPIHVALLRGSKADTDGNISLDEEPANLDIYAMALAAHNSGGKVIFQVRTVVNARTMPARAVRIPSAIVDAVVVDPDQSQSYGVRYDPTISGERFEPVQPEPPPPLDARQIIARRAADELFEDAVINYGFGIPDALAKLVANRGDADRYYQTIEHGTYGGHLLDGIHFGYARNPSCMIDGPSQFDFYSGGGLDIAFLGFGELDRHGNVNVSKLAGVTVGVGGFIDIAQNARKVVFCGVFDTKGTDISVDGGSLLIRRYGAVRKLVDRVAQITFSGKQALQQGQRVVIVTERCVFEVRPSGVVLTEVAPGIDVTKDILERMDFAPIVEHDPILMPAKCFSD